MSKDDYPQGPIKGSCLRVICCMYSVLFCFSYLSYFFEKGGLIFSIFSYFTFLMSFMIIFVKNSYKFYVLFFSWLIYMPLYEKKNSKNLFFILNSYVTSDIVATSMQHHAEVNSNYFNSIDFDIINPGVHAFSPGHVMDIATKPVERCNIVGYNLDQTATFQQLLCFSNKISANSFKQTYTTLLYMFLNITHF